MASAKTAQQIVGITRDLVGVSARDKLGDGFAADLNTADRYILPSVNRAITELLSTGLIKCRFRLPATQGVAEYRLDPGCGLIEYVYYRGAPLGKTSIARQIRDRVPRGIRGAWGPAGSVLRTGTPRHWYNDIPDMIGLSPAPAITDSISIPAAPLVDDAPSIEILAEALADDLVNSSDIPSRVPTQFHEDIATGAAYWLLVGMIGQTDDDADGAEPSDPSNVPTEALAIKLGELRSRWGRPDDASSVGTVFARVRRFAQQREISETVDITPRPERGRYGSGGRWV